MIAVSRDLWELGALHIIYDGDEEELNRIELSVNDIWRQLKFSATQIISSANDFRFLDFPSVKSQLFRRIENLI